MTAEHSHTSTSLCELGTVGSQQRRPNARWVAVGEASEASRDADTATFSSKKRRAPASTLQNGPFSSIFSSAAKKNDQTV